jgi:predicted HAD superfamily Cof-like phosphohydrolase
MRQRLRPDTDSNKDADDFDRTVDGYTWEQVSARRTRRASWRAGLLDLESSTAEK